MSGNVYLNRFTLPVVTGTPSIGSHTAEKGKQTTATANPSFQSVLNGQLEQQSKLTFSKHAAARAEERNIDLSESKLARLNAGVKLAEAKGLNDTLILVDKTAFLVNIKNNKVITTVSREDLVGNVFTNIDGTVII